MKKNKIIIILSIVGSSLLFLCLGLIITYNILLGKVSNKDEVVYYTIESGTSTKEIVKGLKRADLIKSEMATLIYIKLHNPNLQAGTYEFNRQNNAREIIKKINAGDIYENHITITFVEGRRLKSYVNEITKNFAYTEEEVLSTLSDKTYLQELINNYWFLTNDILNDKIYFPLEGYLYPDTYTFYEDASIKDIIKIMLDNTLKKLNPFKEEIENSKYSVHQIFTLASILELEGVTLNDRENIASVMINRMNINMPLGSDVTTYYAAQKDFTTELSIYEYQDCNAYNTRCATFYGLPVGPIANVSINSIDAALHPAKTDYLYFVADKTRKTYFQTTYAEFENMIKTLQEQGLWYTY